MGVKRETGEKKKKVKTVEPDQLQFQKRGLVAATVAMIIHGGGHTVLLPGSSGGDHWHILSLAFIYLFLLHGMA